MSNFSKRFNDGKPLIVSWSMIPSGLSTEVFARGPYEACCIDLQHGYAGYSDMLVMAAPIVAAGKPFLVRVPLENWGMASRVLDAGASGAICPMINTPEDAAKMVAVTKFPPLGERSFGAYRDARAIGESKGDHLATLNEENLAIAMIETRTALDNLDAICETEGLDGVFVGPYDLCVSLTDGKWPIEPAGEIVFEALDEIAAKCAKHGITAGVYAANPEDARKYISRGFTFIALNNDINFLAAASAAAHDAI